MNLNLYHIQNEHKYLIDQIIENGGELTSDLEEALIINGENFETKAISYGNAILSLKNSQDNIKSEIDRLKKLLDTSTRTLNHLQKNIEDAMVFFDIKKVESDTMTLSLRRSKSVEILDELIIPKEYKDTKEVVTISKTRVKEAINAGKIVLGAALNENFNLQIK